MCRPCHAWGGRGTSQSGRPSSLHQYGLVDVNLKAIYKGELKHCMLCADLVDNCTMEHADQTAQSILDVYYLLHSELPNTHILSLAILPKGETWPNRCSEAILSVNAQLQVCPNRPRLSRRCGLLVPQTCILSLASLPKDKALTRPWLCRCCNATSLGNVLHIYYIR